MEIEVTRETRNELLGRREVGFNLRFDGPTPTRVQVIGKLSALLSVQEKQVALDSLKTSCGKTECSGYARVYDTEEQRNKVERSHILSRGMPKAKAEEA